MSRRERVVWAFVLLLFLAWVAFGQDETLAPDADSSSDSNTTCDATVEPSIDEGGTPGGDWCIADNNNTSWTFKVTFPTPSSSLDTTTDAQVFQVFVREFDGGQTGTATITVSVYDGAGCAGLHETGATQNVMSPTGEWLTESWTAAGLSGAADVCIEVSCTKSGGSPSARQSCDIDTAIWDVTWAAASARSRGHVIGEREPDEILHPTRAVRLPARR